MDDALFAPVLIDGNNIAQIAAAMRAAMRNKGVTLKITRSKGSAEVIRNVYLSQGAEGSGVCVKSASDRGGLTNSHHLGFTFEKNAIAFETRDDPLLERYSANCFTITNLRSDGENPILEVVFSF